MSMLCHNSYTIRILPIKSGEDMSVLR